MINFVLGLIFSYLFGSIPTGYIFGKLIKGVDIRQYGSGNIGGTNAIRVLGKGPGFAVLFLDILKGILAITIVGDLFGFEQATTRVFLGIAAVSGHNWTVFLNFKGGKGIATSLGVLIGLSIKFPAILPAILMCVLAWVIIFLAFGYVSLASIAATVFLPILMVFTFQSLEMILLGVIFCVFVVFRHRPNIKRLFAGTESRVDLPFHKKTRKNS